MENIKNFIEEGEKEFEEKFLYWVVLGSTLNDGSIRRFKAVEPDAEEVIKFISSRQISLIKMIMEMVESGKKEVYFLNYKEDSIENAENRGNNQVLDTISSKLSSLVNGEK